MSALSLSLDDDFVSNGDSSRKADSTSLFSATVDASGNGSSSAALTEFLLGGEIDSDVIEVVRFWNSLRASSTLMPGRIIFLGGGTFGVGFSFVALNFSAASKTFDRRLSTGLGFASSSTTPYSSNSFDASAVASITGTDGVYRGRKISKFRRILRQ